MRHWIYGRIIRFSMEYLLMYKSIKVMRFNVETHEIGLLNKDYIPLCIRRQNEDYSFDSVRQFCSLRVLLMNRAYCKELLTSCGVEDQSDINICIISRALSFRDNYWIKSASSEENWNNANLYDSLQRCHELLQRSDNVL